MRRLAAITAACLLFLWAPIAIVAWKGFSVEAFQRLWERPDVLEALLNSLILATVSGIGATLLGTFTAFALPRMPRLARTLTQGGLLFPMLLPEIAFGLAAMTWFIRMGLPLGWGTLAWSHVAFSFSYATLIMKSHVETVDPGLLDAARDLGASRWSVFRHGLLPQILPGIVASFVTSFSLSLDDFLISFFVKGMDQMTLPIQIYGMMKVRIGSEIYALSLLLFCISLAAVLVSQLWLAKKSSSTVHVH